MLPHKTLLLPLLGSLLLAPSVEACKRDCGGSPSRGRAVVAGTPTRSPATATVVAATRHMDHIRLPNPAAWGMLTARHASAAMIHHEEGEPLFLLWKRGFSGANDIVNPQLRATGRVELRAQGTLMTPAAVRGVATALSAQATSVGTMGYQLRDAGTITGEDEVHARGTSIRLNKLAARFSALATELERHQLSVRFD